MFVIGTRLRAKIDSSDQMEIRPSKRDIYWRLPQAISYLQCWTGYGCGYLFMIYYEIIVNKLYLIFKCLSGKCLEYLCNKLVLEND